MNSTYHLVAFAIVFDHFGATRHANALLLAPVKTREGRMFPNCAVADCLDWHHAFGPSEGFASRSQYRARIYRRACP
jgi:hypothetical protein